MCEYEQTKRQFYSVTSFNWFNILIILILLHVFLNIFNVILQLSNRVFSFFSWNMQNVQNTSSFIEQSVVVSSDKYAYIIKMHAVQNEKNNFSKKVAIFFYICFCILSQFMVWLFFSLIFTLFADTFKTDMCRFYLVNSLYCFVK